MPPRQSSRNARLRTVYNVLKKKMPEAKAKWAAREKTRQLDEIERLKKLGLNSTEAHTASLNSLMLREIQIQALKMDPSYRITRNEALDVLEFFSTLRRETHRYTLSQCIGDYLHLRFEKGLGHPNGFNFTKRFLKKNG